MIQKSLPLFQNCDASASLDYQKQNRRFKISCRMLRNAGLLKTGLPFQKLGESQIDWLVRFKIAKNKFLAAEMLILAEGLTDLLNEVEELEDLEV